MAVDKHIFGIFVMLLSCFITAGFGLKCYKCETEYESKDACDRGTGKKIDCDVDELWTDLEMTVQKMEQMKYLKVDLAPVEETKQKSNVVCFKAIGYDSDHKKKKGEEGIRVKKIVRDCGFKKYRKVDGCHARQQLADDLKIDTDGTPNATTILTLSTFKERFNTFNPEECHLCDNDLCNATIGSTPAFFIYPPLLLLVLIISKLFI